MRGLELFENVYNTLVSLVPRQFYLPQIRSILNLNRCG
jgi:hypothetical protein